MHIIIGIISAIAGLIWAINALQRSGFNPASLNPFLWNRRRKWKNLYAEKPIYNLDKPMDVGAVMLLGTLKCEGEISSEQKSTIKSIFKTTFNLSDSEASDLLLASSHLIRDEIYLADNIDKVLENSYDAFSSAQIESLISLMEQLSSQEGERNHEQTKLINATKDYFNGKSNQKDSW